MCNTPKTLHKTNRMCNTLYSAVQCTHCTRLVGCVTHRAHYTPMECVTHLTDYTRPVGRVTHRTLLHKTSRSGCVKHHSNLLKHHTHYKRPVGCETHRTHYTRQLHTIHNRAGLYVTLYTNNI